MKVWSSASALPLYLPCEDPNFRFRNSALPGLWRSEVPLPQFHSTWPVNMWRFEVPLSHSRSTWPVKIWSSASELPLYLACEDLKFRFRSTGPVKIWSSASTFPLYLAFCAPLYLVCEDLKFRFRTSALPVLWRSEVPLPQFRSTWPLKIWSSASTLPLYLACEDLKFHNSALPGLCRSEVPLPQFRSTCTWRTEVPFPQFRSTWPVKIWSSASAILLYLACEDLNFRFRNSALPGLWRSEFPHNLTDLFSCCLTWRISQSSPPIPHLLQAQQALAKAVGSLGTGSYPAPSPDPTTHRWYVTFQT